MKKVLNGVLAVILLLGISACSSNDSSDKDGNVEKKEIYEINETAEIDGLKFTVTKTREDEGLFPAEEGEMYFVIEVSIENTTEEEFASSSMLCYELKDGDGRELNMSIGANLNGSLDTKVDANDKGIGEIAFETKKEGELILEITPNAFSGESAKFKVR